MENLYVLTLVDGQKVLRQTKRVKGAVSAELATEYMRLNAANIYQHWIKAMMTKRTLRTLRWWEFRDGGIMMSGNATINSRETYVATIAKFIRANKVDNIIADLITRSLNAREKRALNAMVAR